MIKDKFKGIVIGLGSIIIIAMLGYIYSIYKSSKIPNECKSQVVYMILSNVIDQETDSILDLTRQAVDSKISIKDLKEDSLDDNVRHCNANMLIGDQMVLPITYTVKIDDSSTLLNKRLKVNIRSY